MNETNEPRYLVEARKSDKDREAQAIMDNFEDAKQEAGAVRQAIRKSIRSKEKELSAHKEAFYKGQSHLILAIINLENDLSALKETEARAIAWIESQGLLS